MQNQTALVASIKAALVAKGQTFTTNCDAAQITFRVAWALRDQGACLIVKQPEQNGCVVQDRKFSHDAIAFAAQGGWVDCLTGAGPPANVNGPSWQWHAEPIAAELLFPPFDPDALEPPTVTPPPDLDLAAEVAALRRDLATLNDVLTMDIGIIVDALAAVRSDVTDLKLQASHGLSGSLFGYKVTLKP